MQLDRYDYQASDDFASFTFDSIGSRGVIKKIINYQPLPWRINGVRVVNLAFGDWNEVTRKVDDSVISNNDDRDKVIATVASTVLPYTEKHGRLAIFATGVTPVKTRLYQMGINAHRVEIEKLFVVFGLLNGIWLPFESGCNYDAFLVFKK